MGCFGPFSVAGFVAGITAVVCMIAVVPFFLWGEKMVCLYKSRLTPKSLSLEVCSGRPGRVRLRFGPSKVFSNLNDSVLPSAFSLHGQPG